MSSVLSFAPVRQAALLALAAFVLLMSFALMPGQAHAADPAVTPTTFTLVSNNASTTLAKVGDTLTLTLVISGSDGAPLIAPQIKLTGLASTSMVGSGRSYSYSTTTYSSGIAEGAVTFQVSVGASTGSATTTLSQSNLTGANVRFDKTVPTISSLTSNATAAGVLKVGDTIVFTLTPGATEYGASVLGQYNGHTLSFASTNGGVTYLGTSTVIEGDADQSTALQLSASITDAAGNLSATTTGSDVVKTIDAHSPSTPTVDIPAGPYTTNQSVSITSTGSTNIHYTLDGTAPTCSAGTLYAGAVNIIMTETLRAAGCDSAGNIASASFSYTFTNGAVAAHSHGSGGGSSHSYAPTPSNASPAAPALANASAHAAFNRNLTVGFTGADVMTLQVWLNAHGFVVAVSGPGSAGMETSVFGGLTRAALAKFQAANHISPAIGFLGPITRAAIAAMQ